MLPNRLPGLVLLASGIAFIPSRTQLNTLIRPLVAMILVVVLGLPEQASAASSLTFTTTVLADTTTAIPSGAGSFVTFDPKLALMPADPCVSEGNMSFWGAGSAGQQGVYSIISGVLTRVADLSSPIPRGHRHLHGLPH